MPPTNGTLATLVSWTVPLPGRLTVAPLPLVRLRLVRVSESVPVVAVIVELPSLRVTAPTVSLFGSQFITWRGIPLIPSDKLAVTEGRTDILLIRTGQARQGVIGLFQPQLQGEQGLGLSLRFMGINHKAIASYLISLYCSLAVLTPDAIAVLENVEVGKYHAYNYA